MNIVVLGLRLLDPDHVVEQQLVAVIRRQPQVGQPGRHTITLRSLPISEWTPNSWLERLWSP